MEAKLSFPLLFVVALGISPAKATTIYTVAGEPFKTQTGCSFFPACPITGSLTGTITTNGTTGTGLSPAIITGWDFFLNDGTDPVVNLTSANSFITSNFSDLLSATLSELDFNFSADIFQENLEFTSSTNGAEVVTIFSATLSPVTIQPGGIGFDAGYSGAENVTYLSGTQPIAIGPNAVAATPLPAALPLFATGLGVMGLFSWRRKRKGRCSRRLIEIPDRISKGPPRDGLSICSTLVAIGTSRTWRRQREVAHAHIFE